MLHALISITREEFEDMPQFRPKYITFDCYGTLTNFQMAEAAQKIYGAQLDDERWRGFMAERLARQRRRQAAA